MVSATENDFSLYRYERPDFTENESRCAGAGRHLQRLRRSLRLVSRAREVRTTRSQKGRRPATQHRSSLFWSLDADGPYAEVGDLVLVRLPSHSVRFGIPDSNLHILPRLLPRLVLCFEARQQDRGVYHGPANVY